MMKKTIYVLTDTEFTSFDSTKGEVFDIAFIITDGFTIIEKFQSYIKLTEDAIDRAILDIGSIVNIDKEKILAAPDPKEVCDNFIKLLHKYNNDYNLKLVGYNVAFDYTTIGITLQRISCEKFAEFESICPREKNLDAKILAKQYYPGLSSYSLSNVCKSMNIAEDLVKQRDEEKHSAWLDTLLLFELIVDMKKRPTFAPF